MPDNVKIQRPDEPMGYPYKEDETVNDEDKREKGENKRGDFIQ